MNIYICATPVSLAAFVVANVCDNVRLQQLQDCLYYCIQEKGNRSRGCILMRDGFIWGIDCRYIRPVGGSDPHFLCMLTSRWMCGEGDHRLSDR